MASNNLNKSIKNTPTAKGGFISELTASTGKLANYPLPVRIKVTPSNKNGPLSDGKKNPAKLMQPVLIKDLFPSTQKIRNNSTLTSVSTQKKRFSFRQPSQPYLNTQSCGKPKKEAEAESSFLLRKSYGGSKVRRQLYQNLDSPPKVVLGNKENASKVIRCKKKPTADNEFVAPKNQFQLRNRTSLLLPPNSIRNTFLKSGTNAKISDRTTTKNVSVSKSIKNTSSTTDLQKSNRRKNDNHLNACDRDNIRDVLDFSQNMRDISTMTTPTISKDITLEKGTNETTRYERPSVIMSPKVKSRLESACDSQNFHGALRNEEAQTGTCSCKRKIEFNETLEKETDLSKIENFDPNSIAQFKLHLKESIKVCENQAMKFRAMLNFLDSLHKSSSIGSGTEGTPKQEESNGREETCFKDELNIVSDGIVHQDDSGVTNIIDKDGAKQYSSNCRESFNTDASGVNKPENDENSTAPIKILITDAGQETTEISSELLSTTVRLSTIGEVSCEADDSNKEDKCDGEDSENKENKENANQICGIGNSPTPKTPRALRRKSISMESCERRRSARLAAKRMSVSSSSDSDRQDSFTMLESELNVKHEIMLSKSLPASPMKPPVTPGATKQWDKKVERPLQEYMALKMNGTFLVTPDVKRFQSCLEPTDTPHSRKSLSRKIFMELCDLYAESPEREQV